MRTQKTITNFVLGLGMLVVPAMILPSAASAGVAVSITLAPPALPVYVQPPCPVDGYLWTPGYWAWGPDGYYWVPGVWVAPPRFGVLWTPGYWGFVGGNYLWHAGYWGPHVGFYGGVNYGFGYGGIGFGGGIWAGSVFRYNTAVFNVNTTVVRNVYVDRTVINNAAVNHVSFNGPGGIRAQATAQEMSAAHEQHFGATANQMSHEQTFAHDHNALASANNGHPGTPAMDSVNGRRFNQQGRSNASAPGRVSPGATPQDRQPVSRNAGNVPRPHANPPARQQVRPAAPPAERPQGRPAPAQRPAPAERPAEKNEGRR